MTKAERTKRFIVEKSAIIINKKGIAGTSITDIMEATKLAKGGIYGNFSVKDEICLEAFDYLIEKLFQSIDVATSDKTNARDKLFALFDFYVDRVALSENGGCPMLNFGVDSDDTNPVIKRRVNKAVKDLQKKISTLIQEGQQDGLFASRLDPAKQAVKIFSLLEGGVLCARVAGSKTQIATIVDMLKEEFK